MQITAVLGADGVTFAHELSALLGDGDDLVVVAPTVRGHISCGLQASPDLDALLSPPGTPTYAVADALESVGYVPRWQRATDRAVATRLVRTELVLAGSTLTDATVAAAVRADLPYRLLPMCEDRVEFRVVVGPDEPHAIHVQDYLDDPAAHQPTQLLLIADGISVSPAVTQALRDTDVLVLGPASRTLAIDPVLRTPGLLELVPATLPVLVVDQLDPAPADLVRVAGLREPAPGLPRPVSADPRAVLDLAREVTT